MLNIGESAPLFEAKNQEGALIKLSDFKGQKVVLYFYPKDATPGCTKEACAFRDSFNDFKEQKVKILGVSRDSVARHKSFCEKYNLPFDLISDSTGEITENYHVWVEKSLYGKKYMGIERSTFLIDEEGIILAIWPKVKVAFHIPEVLEKLGISK